MRSFRCDVSTFGLESLQRDVSASQLFSKMPMKAGTDGLWSFAFEVPVGKSRFCHQTTSLKHVKIHSSRKISKNGLRSHSGWQQKICFWNNLTINLSPSLCKRKCSPFFLPRFFQWMFAAVHPCFGGSLLVWIIGGFASSSLHLMTRLCKKGFEMLFELEDNTHEWQNFEVQHCCNWRHVTITEAPLKSHKNITSSNPNNINKTM